MEGERYVGERRALRHFLQELRPLVGTALGRDSVLGYRIDRALGSGDLAALRLARQIFHNQPETLKRRLMRGIFEAPAARPDRNHLLERYHEREPEPFVRFDAHPSARSDDAGLSVGLDHELCNDVPVRVMIRPGTLPSSAVEALRQIASWIERDRRLLSSRHWEDTRRREAAEGSGGESSAEAGGESVDQA